MGDSEDKRSASIPDWQQAQSTAKSESEDQSRPNTDDDATRVEQARKFLRDETVQNSSRERKVGFLKSKDVAEPDIEKLLAEDAQATPQDSNTPPIPREPDQSPKDHQEKPEPASTAPPESHDDRPPIVTYPEFLTKPAKPPPLMTARGFLNTLSVFAGAYTLLYGTSKYLLAPMVEALTEARISLHETARDDLGRLVEKLESTVSEVPPATKTSEQKKSESALDHDDDQSSYDDPTEMFHRDVGVQTSAPPSPLVRSGSAAGLAATWTDERPSAVQARRLTELTASVRTLAEGLVAQGDDLVNVRLITDAFKEDLDRLSYPPTDFVGGYSLYGAASKNEPDDEIKRAKENIRRVKGVLLSARNFPPSAR